MTIGDLLDVARAQIGQHEDPPGSNRTKYGAWYGMDGSAWCAMFVSWVAAHSGNEQLIPRHAYTPVGASWFQGKGSWERSPRTGSIVYYDISNMGRISHVGIVESVLPDGRWYAIEGNTGAAGGRTGGEVRRQLRSTVGTSQGGFGRPSYTTAPTQSGRPYPGRLFRRGSAGDDVRAIQSALNRFVSDDPRLPIQVDGQFGPATEHAVTAFQLRRRLQPDGIVGPNTWRALSP